MIDVGKPVGDIALAEADARQLLGGGAGNEIVGVEKAGNVEDREGDAGRGVAPGLAGGCGGDCLPRGTERCGGGGVEVNTVCEGGRDEGADFGCEQVDGPAVANFRCGEWGRAGIVAFLYRR